MQPPPVCDVTPAGRCLDTLPQVWKLPKGMDGRDISALSSSGGVGCGTHEPSSSSSSGGGTTAGTSRLVR